MLSLKQEDTRKQGDHEEGEIVESHRPRGNSKQSSKYARSKLKFIKLTPAQTLLFPHPISSTVWYRCNQNQQIASGMVKSISMDILSRKLYYEIEKTLEQDSGLIVDSLPTCIVSDEDVICFGAGCPVRVKMESTSSSLNCQELDGKILFGKEKS
eukprot:CAMPEP_0201971490 /NCGR_PEP_ID=MMETSP0904-20121228/37244_1 /ASSEMBLY_ACC=CAM_ASM_000553 /TAXON_ID=420261 /ORGANISM="Thalassiosira antarctica, Strain CCMP982" /LENGTH=154 /DNA_ID=CAMNT_0048520931 /DNA_START=145 /DNA_END=605 /DNA_ORIENTATION=+